MVCRRPRRVGDTPAAGLAGMALGRSRRDEDPKSPSLDSSAHPGEPGVGLDLAPPFVAGDDETRWLFSLNRFGIRPGLTRIEGLLADLGNPQRTLRTLVTAGTNGKGSTTRILSRLLQDAGYKVATYTSPHLLRVHERIEINDQAVPVSDFAARVKAIRPLTEKHGASWFETLTAVAVQYAHDEGVDFFCCETGLGGRLDASNALPALAILLTTVDLDHQRILGETLTEICAEKLGLLKKGVPVFTGISEELRGQVFISAVTAGSPCFFLDELARWPQENGDAAVEWDLVLREQVIRGLPVLQTPAMARNVALALLALTELEQSLGEKLLPVDPAASLGNLFLPGRYQQVLSNPTWIFDTAHNPQALGSALTEFQKAPCAGRRVVLFGAMYDKDLTTEMGFTAEMSEFFTGCDHLVGLPVNLPRSRTPQELAELFRQWGQQPGELSDLWQIHCTVAPDMASGLRAVAAGLQPDDRVLVTGSCFTVAEVLHRLGMTELDQTRDVRAAGPVLQILMEPSADGGRE